MLRKTRRALTRRLSEHSTRLRSERARVPSVSATRLDIRRRTEREPLCDSLRALLKKRARRFVLIGTAIRIVGLASLTQSLRLKAARTRFTALRLALASASATHLWISFW